MSKAWDDREDIGAREPGLVELPTVELRVAKREVTPSPIGAEFAASLVTEVDKCFVDVDEVRRRGDVVVHKHHPVGKRERHPRCSGTDGEVMNENVVRVTLGEQVAIVLGQVFHARVGGLHIDPRVVAGRAEDALYAERFVADRIAIAQRRQNLVELGLVGSESGAHDADFLDSSAGPVGS